jgi:hypothetical protein
MGGTSVEYLTSRLRQLGRDDLLEGISAGLISSYAAACEAGIITRKATLGVNDNAAKRRNWALAKITGRSPFSVMERLRRYPRPRPRLGALPKLTPGGRMMLRSRALASPRLAKGGVVRGGVRCLQSPTKPKVNRLNPRARPSIRLRVRLSRLRGAPWS